MSLGNIARRRIAVLSLIAVGACQSPTAVETLTVPIASGDTYRHATVGGDEEGAIIITQALHYAISEMRRDSTTNWVATYIYRSAAGFTGRDMVEIEISSSSYGDSPTKVQRLRIEFDVH
jgi:hypothetical protein